MTRKMGRPTAYKPWLANLIVFDLRRGLSVTQACALALISRPTFYAWCDRFPQFLYRCKRARAEAQIDAVSRIRQAAAGSPAEYAPDGRLIKAATPPDAKWDAWWLERACRHYWAVIDLQGVKEGMDTGRELLECVDDAVAREVLEDALRRVITSKRKRKQRAPPTGSNTNLPVKY
jgi:hypothetical protein